MSYRQLTNEHYELEAVAGRILRAVEAQGILSFIREAYGEKAHQFIIHHDEGHPGPSVNEVEVFDQHLNLLLPDFTLPYWKDVDLRTVFHESWTDEEKLEGVYEYFAYLSSAYSDAGFDPDENEELIFLSSLEVHTFPELYVKQED